MTSPSGIVVAWREVPAGSPRREVSRALLSELLPGARFSSRCPSCGGDHGRVRVMGADAAVSVSYAPGWTVVVTTRGRTRIGVDAVPRDARDLERVLPDRSADAIGWARVEAVLKADGRGLCIDPSRVEVRTVDASPGEEDAASNAGGADGAVDISQETSTSPGAADAERKAARSVATEWRARIREESVADSPPWGLDTVWQGWDIEAPDGIVAALAVGEAHGGSRP